MSRPETNSKPLGFGHWDFGFDENAIYLRLNLLYYGKRVLWELAKGARFAFSRMMRAGLSSEG